MELYRKIYIKSAEDLPKEKGKYIFGWDKTDINLNSGISSIMHSPTDDDETKAELVEDFDWYLQPIEITDSDIDFRMDIANELSRDELIDRLCEMNESCRSMKKDEFGEFMEWLKTQPDQTMVTACLIRLWNSFKKQKKKE